MNIFYGQRPDNWEGVSFQGIYPLGHMLTVTGIIFELALVNSVGKFCESYTFTLCFTALNSWVATRASNHTMLVSFFSGFSQRHQFR